MRNCTLIPASCLLALIANIACAAVVTTNPFQGITLSTYTLTVPRTVTIHVAEIDLTAPGLSFQVTPANTSQGGETVPETSMAYANRVHAQLAINTNFFNFGGTPTNNTGLALSNGNPVSPNEDSSSPVLNISPTNVATISTAAGTSSADLYRATGSGNVMWNASAGRYRTILNGASRSFTTGSDSPTTPRARTAVAVNQDKDKLWLVTVDAGLTGYSLGMTIDEETDFLTSTFPGVDGAYNAMTFDGGNSTTMAADYYGDGLGAVQVGRSEIGTPREVGVNLGVFAQPVPEPACLLIGAAGLLWRRQRS